MLCFRFNEAQQPNKHNYKFITMEESRYQILTEIDRIVDINILVAIFEVVAHKIEINTISEMARLEGKSPNGINKSKLYRKIMVGKQKMVVKGLRDNPMPF